MAVNALLKSSDTRQMGQEKGSGYFVAAQCSLTRMALPLVW